MGLAAQTGISGSPGRRRLTSAKRNKQQKNLGPRFRVWSRVIGEMDSV
jgi:hypothetical protein